MNMNVFRMPEWYSKLEKDCFPTAFLELSSAELEAMKNGEVDCMFPANLTAYDGETLGVIMTQPLMTSDMMAVVRESDQQSFIKKESVNGKDQDRAFDSSSACSGEHRVIFCQYFRRMGVLDATGDHFYDGRYGRHAFQTEDR